MRTHITRALSTLILAAFPILAGAVTITAPRDFKGFVDILLNIIQTLVILIFSLTFLAIMWGLVRGWIIHGGDTDKIEEGRNVIFVGVIVFVIMSSVWGVLALLRASLFGS